jgi:hypothetical protein
VAYLEGKRNDATDILFAVMLHYIMNGHRCSIRVAGCHDMHDGRSRSHGGA